MRPSCEPVTSRSETGLEVLDEQVDEIRRTRFSVSTGEHIAGASAGNVPVLGVTGRLVAVVSIHGSRLPQPRFRACDALLVREIRPLRVAIANE